MAFLDLILLIAIAGFLGYRLWTVLGAYDVDKPIKKKKPSEEDLVVPIRARTATATEETDQENIKDAEAKEKEQFMQGAVIAFHKIVEAYADENVQALEKLLADPLLETFEEAIAKRKKAKKKLEVDISRIASAEILDSREEKGEAYITIRFVSEQCLVTRNSKGKVIEGDPDRYVDVTDIWTFSRPVKSSNPNWKLVATQVPEG